MYMEKVGCTFMLFQRQLILPTQHSFHTIMETTETQPKKSTLRTIFGFCFEYSSSCFFSLKMRHQSHLG